VAVAKIKYKFPKAIGACADKLYTLRETRLKAQKVADVIEAEEKALKKHIIENLPKSQASGVAGKLARVTVINKDVPQVSDQEALRKYLNRTKRFDLINNLRPSAAAVTAMWDDGKKIPGVVKFVVTTVSMNKV
jgi:hypothetical protein